MLAVLVVATLVAGSLAIPATPQYFDEQIVDHFAAPGAPRATFRQRYYSITDYFGIFICQQKI